LPKVDISTAAVSKNAIMDTYAEEPGVIPGLPRNGDAERLSPVYCKAPEQAFLPRGKTSKSFFPGERAFLLGRLHGLNRITPIKMELK